LAPIRYTSANGATRHRRVERCARHRRAIDPKHRRAIDPTYAYAPMPPAPPRH